ncbi:hypothetical protein NW762_009985 [Fusarium torreyae]|uniref:HNH nuclease domain-containing protein n=1 Tax=Fusarium torreyae TaxID=1237075 RepID=A0A9W8RTV5_9HYPO|nr:hypothetical protein NW762_009985 [Fusarium torreyae]
MTTPPPKVFPGLSALQDRSLSFWKPILLLPTTPAKIARRHRFAKDLQKKIQTWRPHFVLNSAHVAVVLTVPLDALEQNGWLSFQDHTPIALERKLNDLLSLVKHFLQGSAAALQSGVTSHSSAEDALRRRSDRDACAVTGTKDPNICHIIPFAWNDTQVAIERTMSVIDGCHGLFSLRWIEEYGPLLARCGSPGSSDKAWNMLCLNKQLWSLWSKGYFSFQWLGTAAFPNDASMKTVTLQFNWMVRDKRNPLRAMNLHGENNDFMEMVERVGEFQTEGNPAQVPGIEMSVKSGDIIYIEIPSARSGRFVAMMNFHWSCVKIAGMSGAANSPEFLPDHADWNEVDRALITEDWLAEQAQEVISLSDTSLF